MSELLTAAQSGRARGLLVLGVPGVGKTRLMSEAAAMAQERGVRLARAACLQLTTPLPFDPVFELLRSMGERMRAAAAGSPHELFGALVDRLERLSVAGPMLLCLDDVQWSDAASIDLVHYCLARLTDLPLAWLLAARSGHAQAGLAHRFEREGIVERLELEALSPVEVGQLTEAALGPASVSDELVNALYERTGGNPFLCEEMLRALPSSAALEELVPAAVRDAIEERIARLPEAAQSALGWAAVLPQPFDFDELEAVAGAAAATALEEVAEAGFLVGAEGGSWTFAHSIVRDALHRRLPQRERVRRHGAVADAIAGGPLARVAPQLEHARRWTDAADAYVRLADAALNRGHGEDAAALYERSRKLAADRDACLMRRAQAGRVLALLRASSGDEARREAEALRAELRAGGDPTERLSFLSRYARALMLFADIGDEEGAWDALEEARPLIERAEGAILAEALATRAYVSMNRSDADSALVDAERAVQLAQPFDDPALDAKALHSLGYARGMRHGAAEGVAILERAVERAGAADLPGEAALIRLHLSFLCENAGDYASVQAHARLGLSLEGAPPRLTVLHQSNLGATLAIHGDLDQGLAYQLAARRRAELVGPHLLARIALTHAYIHIWRGELAAARRLLENREPDLTGFDKSRSMEVWGALLEEESALTEALASFERGAAVQEASAAMWCAAGVARNAVALGDVASGRAALVRLDELVARWPVGEWMREEARGWVAADEGRTDEAVARFASAAETCDEAYTATRLRLEAARLAADRKQLLAAIDAFERMGAARAADRARSVARSLGMRPGRRRLAAGALSAREQEVAQLIAAGQTNAEIAAALYLSPRTVERHVSSILTKLNFHSRVQVAAEAAAGRLPGADAVAAGSR